MRLRSRVWVTFLRTIRRYARRQWTLAAELDWGELFRFGIAGSLSTIVYIVAAVALVEGWAMHPSPANIIAFTFSSLIAFAMYRIWTFRHRHARLYGSVGRYAILALVGYGYTGSIAYLAEDFLHVHYAWSLAFITCTWALVSYYAARKWVFSA